MSVLPIQVTENGVLIPRAYLREARAFEFILAGDYVLVKPIEKKVRQTSRKRSAKSRRFRFIASGHTRNPDASSQVEDILLREGLGVPSPLNS